MNNLRKCRIKELGTFDFKNVCDVAFATIFGGLVNTVFTGCHPGGPQMGYPRTDVFHGLSG
jgi:hypothetical protein